MDCQRWKRGTGKLSHIGQYRASETTKDGSAVVVGVTKTKGQVGDSESRDNGLQVKKAFTLKTEDFPSLDEIGKKTDPSKPKGTKGAGSLQDQFGLRALATALQLGRNEPEKYIATIGYGMDLSSLTTDLDFNWSSGRATDKISATEATVVPKHPGADFPHLFH